MVQLLDFLATGALVGAFDNVTVGPIKIEGDCVLTVGVIGACLGTSVGAAVGAVFSELVGAAVGAVVGELAVVGAFIGCGR